MPSRNMAIVTIYHEIISETDLDPLEKEPTAWYVPMGRGTI